MRISSTADIPQTDLDALAAELCEHIPVVVDGSRMFYRSVEAPSWIVLFGDVQTWAHVLGPTVALFFAELVKEAAKDSWRNRAAVGRTLAKPVMVPLKALAVALTRFRAKQRPGVEIGVGFPKPDEHFATRLRLTGTDPESIAIELALFVNQTGALQRLLDEIDAGGERPIGQVFLRLLPDGSLEAEWLDQQTWRANSKVLPPPTA